VVASIAPIAAGGTGASVDYYVNQVATDSHDYYAGHGEAPGTWSGDFAASLGLTGEVTAEQFRSVLEGEEPATGEKLKDRRNTRVAGWDVTLSPPKSISALWALAPDDLRQEVKAAQATAVDEAIGYLTRTACVARLGKAGVDRQDGSQLGFLRCDFTHRCSREGDPQLHTHAILANILQAQDGRRAALDGGLMFQHAKAADGIYQAALRAELTHRLGVDWVKGDETWEVDGIPAGLCREWSKRRSQIEHALAERGLDAGCASGRAAQAATLDTRQAKVQVEPDGSLHDRFHREATTAGHAPDDVRNAVLRAADRQRTPESVAAAERAQDGDAGLLDEVVGPEGVTERASSFSRREAVSDLAGRHAIHAPTGSDAAAHVEHLAEQLVHDDRVVPVLDPAARTTGELLRVRDETGRIVRTVDQAERRYTTVDLLAAEADLLARAQARRTVGVAVIPQQIVDQALADHPNLDPDQQAMLRTLATSGAGVDVVVGKAGTGKSTAIGAYRAALDAAGIPVVGVAPSAAAAHQLGMSAGIADTATIHRFLVELEHGHRTLPHGAVVVLDEAGMCPTRTRLALQQAVDAVGGKVVDVGDHRQIPSVDVGGGHYALAQRLGATTLGVNHRFRDPVYRDAAELLRDRNPTVALELLRAQGAVSDGHDKPAGAWMAMVDDWLTHRDTGDQVLMLATERATVDQLNRLARAHLVVRGDIAKKTRAYRASDDSRDLGLAIGDEVILRRNDARLPQPHGDPVQVRNGMTGRIVTADRRGVTVALDADHATPDGPYEVTLPASYVGAHVDYAYARTVDTAQGATVDHSMFAPSASTSAERAYVALSRGGQTNRIYATTDRAWEDAIGAPRTHTFATDQTPDLSGHAAARDDQRSTSVGLDLDELPDGLAARRAALHAFARHHTTDRRQPTPDRARGPWLHNHADDRRAQDLDEAIPDREQQRDRQHEDVADDGRERGAGISM
jgi:conjugative relaxase-like TrwC/TraI family protein